MKEDIRESCIYLFIHTILQKHKQAQTKNKMYYDILTLMHSRRVYPKRLKKRRVTESSVICAMYTQNFTKRTREHIINTQFS